MTPPLEALGMIALRRLDPEAAHGLALKALQMGLGPKGGPFTSPRLATTLAGLSLPNPVGLAAGFDKNATALAPLARCGFGFVEAGAATPRPQPGNPRPRLFRLTEDRAAINRFGFNNDGMQAIAARLAHRPKGGTLGLNLGANKDSDDRAADFAKVLASCGPHLDFATVNVSSPNTESLRDLQGKAALAALLDGVMAANAALARPIPIFLKIAPDLTDAELADIAAVATSAGLSAIIATNTTITRPPGTEACATKGGLSGAPLLERSLKVVRFLVKESGGRIPVVGCGGITCAADAGRFMDEGACLVQVYSGLVFRGPALAREIAEGLAWRQRAWA